MTNQINEVQQMFASYGFIDSPLTRKAIASLLNRGLEYNDIYSIGCDVAAHE